ncbi:MAG: tetratricopeptide repeat protein [Phycisphaerae bacterium]|nr:tetratricopeptide repeat protein [Phycisphaerae bacterium]
MSYWDSLRVMGELERQFDVNSLRFDGVCVWPIIRNALAASLENENNKTFREPRNGKFNLWNLLPDPAQLELFKQHAGIEYLFYSRAEEYRTRIQGRYYGFVDPYLEIVKDSHRVLKIELNSGLVQTTLPRYYPTVFLKPMTIRIPCPVGTNDIEHFQDLRQKVLSLCPIDLDEGVILEMIHNTEQFRLLFLDVLQRIRPRVVVMMCYYTNPPAMGLIRACRDLGITTVELKHGIPNASFYEYWAHIPEDGYEYLPDWFYVWSDEFRRAIETIQPSGCRHHRALVGPNEWIRKVLQDPIPMIDGVDPAFLTDLERRTKVILITLDYPTDGIPSHVLEAMRSAPKEWIWLLRCHPRYKHDKGGFIDILSRSGISNYEIDKTTSHPLFMLLQRSHCHLTSCSSICLEAMLFGVPSLVYSPAGFEYFRDYIDQGYLAYEANSAESLLRWLQSRHDSTMIRKQGERFFSMDKALGRKAFETLLRHAEGRQPRKVNPRYRAANLNQMGRYHVCHGDLPAAIETFTAAVQCEPGDTEAYNNLGGLCWHLGDRHRARRFIETAMEIDPSDLRTRRNWDQLNRVLNEAYPAQPMDVVMGGRSNGRQL